jgi:hypothetical protein
MIIRTYYQFYKQDLLLQEKVERTVVRVVRVVRVVERVVEAHQRMRLHPLQWKN